MKWIKNKNLLNYGSPYTLFRWTQKKKHLILKLGIAINIAFKNDVNAILTPSPASVFKCVLLGTCQHFLTIFIAPSPFFLTSFVFDPLFICVFLLWSGITSTP